MRLESRLYHGNMSAEDQQEWESSRYAENARFVSDLGQPLVELLNPQPGEHILDLGCGDGALTEKLVEAGAQVVGVDASEDMIAAARRRGLDARVADAYHLTFTSEFDAVFSNAALHWMKRDPDAVIASVWRALNRGGRFAGEMGGFGNVAAITVGLCATLEELGVENPAALMPWYFPTPEEYQHRLERAGFMLTYIELIARPTPLPAGMRGWLETFATSFTKAMRKEKHPEFLDAAVEKLRPALCDSRGLWTADYVRLRFLAKKSL
jgi:trans-aconitate methyltransferase